MPTIRFISTQQAEPNHIIRIFQSSEANRARLRPDIVFQTVRSCFAGMGLEHRAVTKRDSSMLH